MASDNINFLITQILTLKFGDCGSHWFKDIICLSMSLRSDAQKMDETWILSDTLQVTLK